MNRFVLDSSAYFRLAKSFHPLLGDHGDIWLKLLPDTADEFAKQPRLRSKFGWFHDAAFAHNRRQNLLKLTAGEAEQVKNTGFWLVQWVKDQRADFLRRKFNPPSIGSFCIPISTRARLSLIPRQPATRSSISRQPRKLK